MSGELELIYRLMSDVATALVVNGPIFDIILLSSVVITVSVVFLFYLIISSLGAFMACIAVHKLKSRPATPVVSRGSHKRINAGL